MLDKQVKLFANKIGISVPPGKWQPNALSQPRLPGDFGSTNRNKTVERELMVKQG